MKIASLFILFFVITISQYISAQIPQTMSYQGVLTQANGSPVTDGNYSLTFKLYDVVTNGDSLWQETQNVQVVGGLFNVILGSTTPLNLPFDKQYWLGIAVGNGSELTPRTTLTSSPYSLNSHSTLAETLPGQGITIRDPQGEATHIFNADGSSRHTGKTVLEGSAEIPLADSNKVNSLRVGLRVGGLDTAIVAFSPNGPAFIGVSGQLVSAKSIESIQSILGLFDGAVVGTSTEGPGVLGKSRDATGVTGSSFHGAGVGGVSEMSDGVNGLSVNGNGGNFFSYNGIGIRASGPLAGEFNGDIKVTKKIKVGSVPEAPNQERFLVWDADSVIKYRTLPASESFDGVLQDKAFIVKSGGTEVFRVDTNGNSYHKGVETFDDDVIFKGENYKGAKLVDVAGNTIAGFGRMDLETGQRIGVYGKAEIPGDLAGAFDGDVEVNGEIVAGSFHVVNGNGDTLTSFNADGTSTHTGLETYEMGIKTALNNGNILRIDPAEGLTIKTPTGQFIAHIRYDGAAYFAGNVSKGGGSFKIDHPLDPEHKYLYHSFVESPDMMNIYNGNVTLNTKGEAIVELPEWFEALNKDFRYQLTAVGAPGPNLYVAEKINDNHFMIAGGAEGMEVSWQVTGIRKDAYAEKHRIPVEELKKGEEIGYYLHPDSFGLR